MKLQTFIKKFKENKCCITYDGSLNVQHKQQFPDMLYEAYVDALSVLQNQNPFLSNAVLEEGEITQSGVKLSLQASIEELIKMSVKNHWKYSLTYLPLDCGKQTTKEITVWVNLGPIIIRSIEYMSV